MTWREEAADQNLRMAAKMLEQQGVINDLQRLLKTSTEEYLKVCNQRDALVRVVQDMISYASPIEQPQMKKLLQMVLELHANPAATVTPRKRLEPDDYLVE